MIWVPDLPSRTGRDDIEFLVAAQSRCRLYVLVEAPAVEQEPGPGHSGWHVRVRTAAGEAVLRNGGAEYGAGVRRTFIDSTYEPLPDPSGPIDVTVELHGEPVYRIRATPAT